MPADCSRGTVRSSSGWSIWCCLTNIVRLDEKQGGHCCGRDAGHLNELSEEPVLEGLGTCSSLSLLHLEELRWPSWCHYGVSCRCCHQNAELLCTHLAFLSFWLPHHWQWCQPEHVAFHIQSLQATCACCYAGRDGTIDCQLGSPRWLRTRRNAYGHTATSWVPLHWALIKLELYITPAYWDTLL